jgi:hypothetical protein
MFTILIAIPGLRDPMRHGGSKQKLARGDTPGAAQAPVDQRHVSWLKVLALAGLLVSAIYFAPHAIAAIEEEPIPDVHSVPATVSDRRGSEAQPVITSKPLAELHQDDVERAHHASNEWVTTIATIVLAVFTALLWVANIWLIVLTNRVSARQASDTEKAIREATRSANAMQDVAEATTRNALMMRDIFAKQMRAYLTVEGGRAWAQTDTAQFQGQPVITNNGLTPARNVCFKVLAGIFDGSSGVPQLSEIGELIVSDMAIAPRQQFVASSPILDRVPDGEAELIKKGETRRLFVWGRVAYDDVFGGHWVTNFCISYHFWMYDGKIQFGTILPNELTRTYLKIAKRV